ncbi:Bdr family repetitive protein [Borreliella valaisiana]|uniref:Bdr family repetitive protein n=1 Tax=Borreliella valaisiana TaxID=62088 RepID=UPI001AEFC60E|nr:Bdr family repetitive protein [Borreliella valaisiana]
MNNLAYRTYNIESIKNEFLNIGFSEKAIDFVLLHNDNYNFEYLKEKIINVEKNLRKDVSRLNSKIDIIEKDLDIIIDSIKNKFNSKIYNLGTSSVYTSLDNLEKNLSAKISRRTKTICISFIVSNILGPFIHSFLMQYLQGVK